MMKTPWPADSSYLQVADLVVDLRFRRLILRDQRVELPQRAFELLLLFLAEPEVMHLRSELLSRLWPGTVVEDAHLSHTVWLLRKALGGGRKSWIHTVAKNGYVFQGAGTVRWFEQPPSAIASAGSANNSGMTTGNERAIGKLADRGKQDAESFPAKIELANEPNSAPERSAAATSGPASAKGGSGTGGRGLGRLLAFAALAMIAIAAGGLLVGRSAPAYPGVAIAVVTIRDQGTTANWPAKLLEQWLNWKLSSLPKVDVLDERDLAVGDLPASVKVVMLSSVPSLRDPAKIALHARFSDGLPDPHMEVEGFESDMPALVDSISRRIVARLQPEYEDEWPALEVSADAASHYMRVVQALERRDWVRAMALGQEVVARAPRFGLMRLQLAKVQARLAMPAAAIAQMDQGLDLLGNSPPPVAALLRAQRLALDPKRNEQALAAYAKVVDDFPGKTSLQLEYACLLIREGDGQRALERLSDLRGGRDRVGISVGKELLRAEAYAVLGDAARMRAAAKEAARLARGAGPEWNPEQASALLAIGRADIGQFPGQSVPPEFEQAALLYEQAGNSADALNAHAMAQLAESARSGGKYPTVEMLLARQYRQLLPSRDVCTGSPRS